jgi:hypothetical protein
MRKILIFSAFLLFVAPSQQCWSQFIRIPVRLPVRIPVRVPVVRAPVVPHVPHVPHIPVHAGTGQHQAAGGKSSDEDVLLRIALAVAGMAGVAITWCLVRKWRAKRTPRALVRITAPPPGEAPEWVRACWVGLELPLIPGQVRPLQGPAYQVLSRSFVLVPDGYAVDGKAAVQILESANVEAGGWWRANAPDVCAPGYQMVFPAQVCERLDDLG